VFSPAIWRCCNNLNYMAHRNITSRQRRFNKGDYRSCNGILKPIGPAPLRGLVMTNIADFYQYCLGAINLLWDVSYWE